MKTYRFCDIALNYFPHLSQKAASNQLRNWINASPQLIDALAKAGCHFKQRLYTPVQREIIERHLGEPYSEED